MKEESISDLDRRWNEMTRQDEPQIVTPLHRLLSCLSMDELIQFLHEMRIGYYIRRDGEKYVVRLRQAGMVDFESSTNGKGPKSAIVNVLVRFLVHERKDFHDVQKRAW